MWLVKGAVCFDLTWSFQYRRAAHIYLPIFYLFSYAKDKNKMDIEIHMYRKVADFQKVPSLSNLKVPYISRKVKDLASTYVVIYLSEKPLWANVDYRYSKILLVVAKSKADARTSWVLTFVDAAYNWKLLMILHKELYHFLSIVQQQGTMTWTVHCIHVHIVVHSPSLYWILPPRLPFLRFHYTHILKDMQLMLNNVHRLSPRTNACHLSRFYCWSCIMRSR